MWTCANESKAVCGVRGSSRKPSVLPFALLFWVPPLTLVIVLESSIESAP